MPGAKGMKARAVELWLLAGIASVLGWSQRARIVNCTEALVADASRKSIDTRMAPAWQNSTKLYARKNTDRINYSSADTLPA